MQIEAVTAGLDDDGIPILQILTAADLLAGKSPAVADDGGSPANRSRRQAGKRSGSNPQVPDRLIECGAWRS
jgi:hypothetical protein